MRNVSSAPSIVPEQGVIYVVLDDFGKLGRAFRETDEGHATFNDVVENILVGEYENPRRVFAFNPAEGWSKDVTLDVAFEVRRRVESGAVGRTAARFLEREFGLMQQGRA